MVGKKKKEKQTDDQWFGYLDFFFLFELTFLFSLTIAHFRLVDESLTGYFLILPAFSYV